MRVFFNPYDILLFRDSRPFNAGEAHLARTRPFVPPMTVTGAIRAALYSVDNEKYSDFINIGKEKPGFKVKGAFWWNEALKEELFPLPKDIVKVNVDGTEGLKVLSVHEPSDGYRVVTADGGIRFSEASGYLSKKAIIAYLKGEFDNTDDIYDRVIPIDEVFKTETRIGIGLNSSKTTVEGLLYRTENLRPEEGIKVVAWVEDHPKLKEGLREAGAIRLGGEGHFAFIEVKEDEKPWEDLEKEIELESDCIRLYVATPLIVHRDSGYTWDITKALAGDEYNIEAELIKAFVSKPLRIEGWDLDSHRPKKPRFAVPAGSVYYLKVTSGLENIKPVRNLGELTCLGYGLVFAGNAKCEGD